jgi:hypothetical protein
MVNENYSLAKDSHSINRFQIMAELEIARIKSEITEEINRKIK